MHVTTSRRALGHLHRAALPFTCALYVSACTSGSPTDPTALVAQSITSIRSVQRVRAAAGTQTVTLITGDRVTLRGGAPRVTPGPGRAQVHFTVHRFADRVVVMPDDAAPLIARGELDAALFDVTGLIAQGYDDAHRDDLPLIITNAADTPALARSLTSDVVVDRALPALHMVTARQPKSRGGAALAAVHTLAAGHPLARGAAPKIWLDRIRHPTLDRSVPQIGGTAAHARGFTGTGITVAVLDTGIDVSHPDLATQVALSEDFTGDGAGVGDVVGHGTHVASIIAGTGAASGGQFAGVAPGARLISGRVCADFGCPDSAILAGMMWAVADQHARIVNLSLGGGDTPDIDPLEEAVNTLSAQFGALFVVAAGNDGADRTIESPGSADAALSVGAVDRDDSLAPFSSRGPRIGDEAIKPEVTAPGVGIVAARASGIPPIGDPVGDSYMALSGTSMATPHVAGAAALLLQQHPGWTGAQLKAQLMASAHPTAGVSVFAQGAGRIDVDRGTRQDVTAEPADLSLGVAAFPHDDDAPIVRTVHYHNGGAAPITLALAVTLDGPAGPGVASVTPATITVPAGGTSADVVVTVHTDGALADGLYSGALIATAGDVVVETPIGVDRAIETFAVTLTAIADGAPSFAFVNLFSYTDRSFQLVVVDGTTTLHLPRGTYELNASLSDAEGSVALLYPRFTPDRDTTIAFDTALAQSIDIDVGDPGVSPESQNWTFVDYVHNFEFSSLGSGVAVKAGQLGPPLPADEAVGWTVNTLTDIQFAPSRIYHVARSARGGFPDGFHGSIARDKFAMVQAHHAGFANDVYQKAAFAVLDDGAHGLQTAIGSFDDTYDHGSFDRTELFFGQGFLWEQNLLDTRLINQDDPFLTDLALSTELRRYAPRSHATETWNRAPAGPAFAVAELFTGQIVEAASTAARTGDELVLFPSMVADPATPSRLVTTFATHERVGLLRDGVSIFEDDQDPQVLDVTVPPEAATYRYEHELDRDPALFPWSTHVSAAWTFRSAHASGAAPQSLPLLTMRFVPTLDDQGTTGARILILPIRFERPPSAGTPNVTDASLEASFDDGAHWHHVPLAMLGDHALAVVVHPKGPQRVSLRSTARDREGNRLEQTIVRAYGVR